MVQIVITWIWMEMERNGWNLEIIPYLTTECCERASLRSRLILRFPVNDETITESRNIKGRVGLRGIRRGVW